ncbi:MAG: AMP-binding protein [Lachnospiraceae bacterium]|nr:AMP-binding protein [Lachnospiraceae bacterium]
MKSKLCTLFENTGPEGGYFEKEILFSGSRTVKRCDIFYYANVVADYLQKKNVKANDIICVLAPRCPELIYCVLGIVQAGGAYLVIDPALPDGRIREILAETGSKIVLIQREYFDRYDGLCMETILEKHRAFEHIQCHRQKKDLLYIVYTSGTTGVPKAIMVEDGNFVSYLDAFIQTFHVNEDDRYLQLSPCNYDGFAEEIFSMLTVNGGIVLPKAGVSQNPKLIAKVCREAHVTMLASTPSMIRFFNKMPEFPVVRLLLSSGEELQIKDYDQLVRYCQVYNMYGTSETTVLSTYKRCSADCKPTLGKPLSNSGIIICDDKLNQLPDGKEGQIIIQGDGVSRGYLNAKSESFIEIGGKKSYKTGDIGYIDRNGELVFIGRKDRQIKIHGNRVDLNEVERHILCMAEVENGAATTIIHNGEPLIGFVYTGQSEIKDIISQLRNFLPEYMMPRIFRQVEYIPLLENGKVDSNKVRKLLEERFTSFVTQDVTKEREDKLFWEVLQRHCLVWAESREQLENADFQQLGIDSLGFVELLLDVEENFGMTFEDEFLAASRYQTVRQFYEYVKQRTE